MDIELEIEGIDDLAPADAIRRRVRAVRQQFTRAGDWRMMIAPSETRGEWDFGVRAPSGWHLASFAESIDGLPDFIERRLRECLRLPIADTPAV
ncbi:MAG: hypothetical protein AUI11_11270 [Acidobacteria bacterium 13_2_20CM_2_66_4]|nr:MAG: hypothetical protein AUI11_11270 [Acidobacteria bacterium 13_2_20CM_2_66_4]